MDGMDGATTIKKGMDELAGKRAWACAKHGGRTDGYVNTLAFFNHDGNE